MVELTDDAVNMNSTSNVEVIGTSTFARRREGIIFRKTSEL